MSKNLGGQSSRRSAFCHRRGLDYDRAFRVACTRSDVTTWLWISFRAAHQQSDKTGHAGSWLTIPCRTSMQRIAFLLTALSCSLVTDMHRLVVPHLKTGFTRL